MNDSTANVITVGNSRSEYFVMLRPTTTTSFRIYDIEWRNPRDELPSEVCLELPDCLVNLGYEDFEPDDVVDNFTDDDWDDYEPSSQAEAAFDAEWDRVITELLEASFNAPVASIGGFEPA